MIGGRTRGAIIKCRKSRNEDEEVRKTEINLKFVTKENRVITVEEIDEFLAVEKKDKSKVLKMSRDYGHASLLLPEENILLNTQKWRNAWDFPVKVSNSAVYLGKSDPNRSDVVQVKLTGIPVWMEREELVEWLSWFGQIVGNLRIKRIQEGDPLNNP